MIEETVRNHLLTALSVPVYIDVPAEPPESYVVIERTGGSEENKVRYAQVAVQSYAGSRYQAATLHENVLVAMDGLNDYEESCDVNAEYDFTDTSTKRYRYQAVFDITYY